MSDSPISMIIINGSHSGARTHITGGGQCVRVRVECQWRWGSAAERRKLVCYSLYSFTYLIIISIYPAIYLYKDLDLMDIYI